MKQFKHKTLLARASMMLLAMLCFLGGARAQETLFSENFESGSMPTGWTTDGPGTWSVGTGDYSSSTEAGQGTYNAIITHSTTGTATKLITPVIDLSSVTSAELSFMHIQRSWAGDYDELRVYYRNSSDGTWTLLAEYTSAVASWTTEDGIVLPNLSSTYQIAFEMTDGYGYGVGVDDVKIVQGASCPKPAGLNVTTNAMTATFTWQSDADWFEIAHSTNADANPDDAITAVATTNSYNFTDLALGDHYVWVRTVCGTTEQSGWAGPLSFHIGYCVPNPSSVDGKGITKVSFGIGDNAVNNIDETNGLPATSPFYGDYTSMIGSAQAGVESTVAITYATGSNTVYSYGTIIWVDWDNSLSFEDNEIVYTGTSAQGSGGTPQVLEASFVVPATQALGDYRMRIAGADSYFDNYIGGNATANHSPCFSSSYAVCHDYTLRVLEAPSCLTPTGLTVNYTGGTTAEVSWTSDADNWQLAFVDGEGTITSVSTVSENPYTLTGLELGTTYRLAIRTVCGEGSYSEWTSLTSPVTFTTDQCMPEDMIVVNYTLNDEYGDGWNGNYILVVDENCNIVEQITLASGASATGTVKVCGSLAQFMWYKGNYPGEASWTFTDADGNVLFEGTGSTDMADYDVLYTIDLNPYSMPSDIEVSEVGPYSAKVAWTETGTATAWQIGIFDNNDDLISTVDANSNPFTLTGLDPETDYYVKVRAVGSNGTSLWPCIGSSFTTLEGCGAPTALNITPYPTSAEVDWANYEGAYDIAWAEVPATKNGGRWMQYDNGTAATSIGGSTASEQSWGVMYPPTMTQGYTTLSKIAFYVNTNYHTKDITVNIYQGENPITGTLQGTQTVTPATTSGMMEVTLDAPLTIDPTQNLWITLTTTGTYVKTACSVTEPNDRWVLNDGAWVDVATLNENLAGYGWMIRGYVEDYDSDLYTWNSETGIEPPYTIENLNAETTYMVKVKASCGTEWKWVQFTTPSACDAPIDLAANDVTADAATLSWTGYQDNYNVRYRSLGTPLFEDYFTNGMDNWTTIDADGDGYTWVLGSECGGVYLVEGGSLSNTGHNASGDMVASGSYSNMSGVGALTPDNYLVSPQVTLGGSITFWACAQDASYPAEHFGVAVSTTGNTDAADFTTIAEWTMTADGSGTEGGAKVQGSWGKFTVDLSAYAGQDGYVAIRHFDCTDKFMLIVDDIVISAPQNNTWVDLTSDDTSIEISGLAPDTEYEWQVQGINAGCDGGVTAWSETATFTTWGVEDILFAKDGYATYYNSIRDVVLPEGMKAHVVTDGSTTLTYNKVADGDEENNVVPAGTAMLLQVEEAAADHSISVYLARPSVAAYTGTNLMFGSDVETTTTGGDKYYKLTYSSSGTNFGWYWGAANGIAFSSPAHKAWLALPASGAPSFLGLPDWDTTGIVPVSVNPEDGEWYTLQGMKVGKKPTTAGVYIHNGKKFVIK